MWFGIRHSREFQGMRMLVTYGSRCIPRIVVDNIGTKTHVDSEVRPIPVSLLDLQVGQILHLTR